MKNDEDDYAMQRLLAAGLSERDARISLRLAQMTPEQNARVERLLEDAPDVTREPTAEERDQLLDNCERVLADREVTDEEGAFVRNVSGLDGAFDSALRKMLS